MRTQRTALGLCALISIAIGSGCATPTPTEATAPLSPVATARGPHLDEALAECRRVGERERASCHYQVFEERPAMMVGFPSLESAAESELANSDRLADRFCPSASEEALIVVSLANGEIARLFSCDAQRWGNWFEVTHPIL